MKYYSYLLHKFYWNLLGKNLLFYALLCKVSVQKPNFIEKYHYIIVSICEVLIVYQSN